MHTTRLLMRPSNNCRLRADPMGLSKDEISQKIAKGWNTRLDKIERQSWNDEIVPWDCCGLGDKRRWKPNELSKLAKERIYDGCTLIQRKYGAGNVCFFTGTLPRGEDWVMSRIDEEWPEIVRLFVAKVRYYLGKGGCEPYIVHKTEFQADGTPHIHVVYPSRRDRWSRFCIDVRTSRRLWKQAVETRVGVYTAGEWKAATRVETVRKSAAGYMCKYLTKEISETVLEDPTNIKQFWGMTDELRKLIKDESVDLPVDTRPEIFYALVSVMRTHPGVRAPEKVQVTKSHYHTIPFTATNEAIEWLMHKIGLIATVAHQVVMASKKWEQILKSFISENSYLSPVGSTHS